VIRDQRTTIEGMTIEKRPVSFLKICLDENAVRHPRLRSNAIRQQAAGFKTNPFFTMSMSAHARLPGRSTWGR
jgi:hypothetical protein